jgi:hypothetical protein
MKAILNFSKKNGKINMENGVVFHFFCLMICLTKIPLYFSTNTKHILHTLCYVEILLRRFILREREATEKLLVVVHQRKRRNQRYAQLLLVSYLPMVNHSLHVLNTTCKIILQVKE